MVRKTVWPMYSMRCYFLQPHMFIYTRFDVIRHLSTDVALKFKSLATRRVLAKVARG